MITALGATQQSLMLRDMDFRRVEMLPMIGALAGGVAAVVTAAACGARRVGDHRPAARRGASSTTLLVWLRSEWRPRLAFSRASLRDLGGFSAYMLGQRMLYYLQVNGDRFLIGRFLGTAALGVYAVAYNTMLVPASKLGGPLQRVFSPAFSRIQDEPERIAATWARVARLLAAISVPALAGLIVVAPDFVPLVLGDQWDDGRPGRPDPRVGRDRPGAPGAQHGHPASPAGARGRCSASRSCVTAAHLIAFAVGLQWGVVGVAVAYAISTTLVEPPRPCSPPARSACRRWCSSAPSRGVFQAALGHVRRGARACGSRSSTPASAPAAAARALHRSPARVVYAACCAGGACPSSPPRPATCSPAGAPARVGVGAAVAAEG